MGDGGEQGAEQNRMKPVPVPYKAYRFLFPLLTVTV
jgi:hypothetical protein